jgi:hypothetical protein
MDFFVETIARDGEVFATDGLVPDVIAISARYRFWPDGQRLGLAVASSVCVTQVDRLDPTPSRLMIRRGALELGDCHP